MATIAGIHSANANFNCKVFLCHRVVSQPRVLAVELRRTSRQWLRVQTIPTRTLVARQPSVNGRPLNTKNTGDEFGTLAVLNALHRSDANLCQRLMIELACVVFSHAGREINFALRRQAQYRITYERITVSH